MNTDGGHSVWLHDGVRWQSAVSIPKPGLRSRDCVSVEGVVPPTPHIRLRTPRELAGRDLEATAETQRRRGEKTRSRWEPEDWRLNGAVLFWSAVAERSVDTAFETGRKATPTGSLAQSCLRIRVAGVHPIFMVFASEGTEVCKPLGFEPAGKSSPKSGWLGNRRIRQAARR